MVVGGTAARPFPVVQNHRAVSLPTNALWLLVERAGTLALVLAFTAWAARQLGEAAFGQWAWLAALTYLGNTFTTFGTDTLLIRNIAQTRTYHQITAALVWQLTLTGAWWLVLFLALIFVSTELRWSLVVASLALWPLTFYSVFSAVLRAHQQMFRFMLASLGMALFQLISAGLWLRAGDGVLKVAIIAALAPLVGAVLAALFLRGVVPLKSLFITTPFAEMKGLVRSAWPFAALTGCTVLYQRLSVLLLAPLAGEAATGLFSAAARLADGLKLGHYAVLGTLLPALSQHPRRTQNVLWFLFALALGLAFSVSTLAPTLTHILFGPRFAPSGTVLAVLAWLVVPYTLTAYLSVTHVAGGAEQTVLWVNITSVALLGLALLLVVPRWGMLGAARAAVLIEAAQAVIFIVISWRRDAPRRVSTE